MKVTLRETVPTEHEITAGLDLHAVHPALAEAELAERQRAQDLEEVKASYPRAIDRAESLARDVRTGRATSAELEQAMRDRSAAALSIVAAERSLAEATASRVRGEQAAREKLRAEAKRRNDNLQRIADLLAPVLETVLEVEIALEHATRRALQGDQSGLPAVVWPACLRDTKAMHAMNYATMRGGAASGATPGVR